MKLLKTASTIIAACWLLYGCSSNAVDREQYRNAAEIYTAAQLNTSNGYYERAATHYEQLLARYPYGDYAIQAQLELIYNYYRDAKPDAAVHAANDFLAAYPRSPYTDYAWYMKGVANFTRANSFMDKLLPPDRSQTDASSAVHAMNNFSELISRYPDSRYVEDAKQRVLYLRNTVARHEIHVGEYYLRKKAYVAAINRAAFVLKNHDGTPAVADALVLQIRAYRALNMSDLAADSLRVLEHNFPQDLRLNELKAHN